MITLYGFGAGFGLPEISPFVTKTEVQLKMAGLAYRKEKAKPPASPKGQLPDGLSPRVIDLPRTGLCVLRPSRDEVLVFDAGRLVCDDTPAAAVAFYRRLME